MCCRLAGPSSRIDGTLVIRAIGIRARWQLSFWDSLIVSAAERAGCEVLYSEDMVDGQTYGSVTVRNPYREPDHG